MLNVIMLIIVIASVTIVIINYAEHLVVSAYAEHHFTECHNLD